MNVSNQEVDSAREILYLSFNQTATALSVGSKNGYMVYDLDQVHECMPTYESRNIEDISIIERNFSMCLIVYVSLHSPRNLVLYNYTKGIVVCEKFFPNTVLSVKLNRKNVVVCLEDSIYILCTMELSDENTHAITNTPPNLKGLCALSYGNGNSLLAYPGSSINGDVQIFDATERHAKTTIPAHTSQLAALAFDENGEKLATASIKGTVIRVFAVASRQILFEFRRGVKRCVEIHSLSFSKEAEFLCASSNTETVHIFKLCQAETVERLDDEAEEGWMEMFGRVLTQSAKYLPTQVSDVLTQQRSFATVHLPFVDQKTVCAISKIQNVSYVLVASLEGFLYIYELNVEMGGSCHLVKQHRLEGPLRPFLVPVTSAVSSLSSLKSQRVLEESKPSPLSNIDLEHVPTQPYEPPVVSHLYEDNSSANMCASNGIVTAYDELPPLLNKVE